MANAYAQRIVGSLNLNRILHNRQSTTYAAISVAAGIPILTYWIANYRAWLALGRGGLPPNPLGWLMQACLHLISRSDTRAPAPWTSEETEAAWAVAGRKSFFDSGRYPPPRAGARPNVPTYVVPQRQTTEQASTAMLDKMETYLSDLAAANPGILHLKPSGLEGPFRNAIWLTDTVKTPAYIWGTKGEIIHPHDEGSTHLVLSLSDATRAIELGWAERHKLSGVWGGVLPWGYVLFYAARNDEELNIWKDFVLAAVKFNAEAALGCDAGLIALPPM